MRQQVARDGPREREAVERRRAAADLVHQHEALRRRVVEDCSGFGHLDHERRAAAREIVRRADPCEDPVDRAEACRLGRHVAAHVGHQRDQRGLPHECRFTAHVRTGNQQQLALGAEAAVVRDELFDLCLDDRVAALFDFDADLVGEGGGDPVECAGAFGECGEQVELGECRCDALALRDERQQCLQHRVVQRALARQCAFLRGQRLVLEGLQFGRDVALGVLQRLAPAVIVGHLVGLAARDLDVEAVHLVVFDAQVRDAGARAFARFEIDQELPAVLRDVAQLVELGVVAARDDTTVAHHRGRLGRNRAGQQVQAFGGRCERCVDAGECVRVRDDRADALAQCRQRGERVAQARQVARAGGQQRETPGDPFDVGDLAQRAA